MDRYPMKVLYCVTPTCGKINLEDLLDHTVNRLLTHLRAVLETLI